MVFTLDELQILITKNNPQIKHGIYSNLHPSNLIKVQMMIKHQDY